MSIEERVRQIAQSRIPEPVIMCCAAKEKLQNQRNYEFNRLMMLLNGLTDDQVEMKLKEWGG
jgi:hypothetical protein